MNLKVLARDTHALQFVNVNLRIVRQKKVGSIIEFQCDGGAKSVGIYSVPAEQMLPKRRGRSKLAYSLYHPENSRLGWTSDDLVGVGRKVRNQVLRISIQPTELTECDLYLVLNQEGGYNSYAVVADLTAASRIVNLAYRGRGGEVVFNQFLGTGRVITEPTAKFRRLSGNQVIQDLLGLHTPVVTYGTTDAANVFELLQTIKAAHILGLPAVFDSYEVSHEIASYWQRIMLPSLRLFGVSAQPEDFGFDSSLKFNAQQVSGRQLQSQMREVGLLGPDLPEQLTFAQWQRIGMQEVASLVMQLALESPVPLVLHTTEALLSKSPYWNWSTRRYAEVLEGRARHPVVALHQPRGYPIRTNQLDLLTQTTIAQAHVQGYWLSGAGIYWGQYALSEFGNIIFTVKDSTAGEVHRLAEPYLQEPHKLYLMPVGLFRICAEGQDEDDSIDPWVMLTIMHRWNTNDRREWVQAIWNAMEVPLAIENIGTKTVVRVGLDDITVARHKAS